MIAVRFLRWISGYVNVRIGGRFPERFLNVAARKGINLWGLRSSGEDHTAFARNSEIAMMKAAAEKTGTQLTVCRHYGLPYLVKRYRNRAGLPAGLVAALIFLRIMSGYIWNITISTPDLINEYEIRQLLADNGVTVGARSDSIDVPSVINRISSSDRRISWMTLNLLGTTAEVALSPNLAESMEKKETHTACNILSSADGVVTRVQAYNGSARVKVGDGIHRNQLLVSGVMEYNNGSHVLADSEARIFARTARSVTMELPVSGERLQKTDTVIIKRDLSVFGLRIPLSLNGDPDGLFSRSVTNRQGLLFDSTLPLKLQCEEWQEYEKKPVELTLPQAQEYLEKKLKVYEWFMIASAKSGTLLQRHVRVTREGDRYRLKADYELEEDVGYVSVIDVRTDEADDPAPPD